MMTDCFLTSRQMVSVENCMKRGSSCAECGSVPQHMIFIRPAL